MRFAGTLTLLSLSALLFSLPSFANNGFISLGIGTASQKTDVTFVKPDTTGTTTTSDHYTPAVVTGKIGLRFNDKLTVFGTAIDTRGTLKEGNRVDSGFFGVGASYSPSGYGKGLFVAGAVGKSYWQEKALRSDAFEGKGNYVGAGLFLSPSMSLEVDCISGKTSGTYLSPTSSIDSISTDRKTYAGTINIKF